MVSDVVNLHPYMAGMQRKGALIGTGGGLDAIAGFTRKQASKRRVKRRGKEDAEEHRAFGHLETLRAAVETRDVRAVGRRKLTLDCESTS